MFKKIIVWIALILALIADSVFAESNVKVAIFPFQVYSQSQQADLGKKVPAMVAEKLKLEGAQVIVVEESEAIDTWEYSNFRERGISFGADYILTGSVFIAGKGISVDSRLIDVYDPDNVHSFYTNVKSAENLFSAVSKISKETIGQVFKKVIIADISVVGNKRVEMDAILRVINTQPGDLVKPVNISKDLRKIYKMGYFDDVVAEQQSLDTGVKVVFKVVEKPSVRKVSFTKNSIYEDEELSEFVDTRTGSILNLHKINSDLNRIRLMYTEKNYHNCQISYKVIPLENSQADIIFTIIEGNKIRVEKITFEGNKYFSDKEVKKAMQTSEKGFFSFLTTSGDLNEDEVRNDVVRIESLYKNNGFIDAKVSDPDITIGEDSISIHFEIKEGVQYSVSQISLKGDLIGSKDEILELIQSKEDQLYNRENIRKDIIAISDLYSNQGYANVNIKPLTQKDGDDNQIKIIYQIDKNDPVYFRRINISGNIKTRDKVIRREIKVQEQGLFSKKAIQRSYKNLNRLNYFETIDVKPIKTGKENELDLDVIVTERQTGQVSFGGGYSTDEAAFLQMEVAERNLFGKGQTGKVTAKVGSETILYNINFHEPYIFDTPISGGFNLYKEDKEYDHYDKDSIGFSATLGYRLSDDAHVGVRYNIEDFEISNVDTSETSMTPGTFLSSSIKPFIKYDSRDDYFIPTEGMTHEISIEYAGEFIGSEIDYTKYLAETSFFFPVFWKFTLGLHAEGGYLDDRSEDTIDIDYVRFYLGGMKSIRGFDTNDINGQRDGDPRERGGEKYVQFNAELTFPVSEEYRVAGVLFYDRGDVYRTSESIDLGDQFSSFGAGIRWNSPMGPIRLEYGIVIDGKNVKETGDGEFAFSVGASF